MKVLGIDVSTRAVHMCALDLDSDRYSLYGYDATSFGDAISRARTLASLLPRRRASPYDGVSLVAIERPMGPGTRQVADMMLVCGVVVASLPSEPPIWLLGPTEWRKACGVPGNASKEDVRSFAMEHWDESSPYSSPASWGQDLVDAYCIAWGARALNEKAVAKVGI